MNPIASLTASLTATVDSVVTLTLKITNTASTPATIDFASGQQYDFTIIDAASGARVWCWSDGVAFAMVLGGRTVAANGSLAFTERWKPTQKGSFVALGSLVSLSHRAEGKTMFTVL